MECRYIISFSCIVLRVLSAIIINKPNDLFAHAKPIFTLIVLTCTTYGIQSSHKCYTEPYFVRLLVCLTRMSTASLMLLFFVLLTNHIILMYEMRISVMM